MRGEILGMSEYSINYQQCLGKALGRKHTCGNKIDYKSKYLAEQKAIEISPAANHELVAYQCPFCNGWHIGGKISKPDGTRAIERAQLLGYLK